MPQAQQVIDEIQEEAKNYNRIYIASIHPDLTEEDIKSVFEAFGSIVFCKLAAGTTSVHSHKGYGFIEYSTNQAALEAIASMNLFDLGGQLLRVGRAITPPNALVSPSVNSSMPTAAAVAGNLQKSLQNPHLTKTFVILAAAATAKIQAMDAVATTAVFGLSSSNQSLRSPSAVPLSSGSTSPLSMTGITVPPTLQPPQMASVGQSLSSTAAVAPSTVVHQPEPPQQVAPPVVKASPSNEEFLKQKQEELQKKLLEEGEPQTLQQQETMSIKGQSARHLVMQRLMRPREGKVIILRNMVGPEDVDETLQEEIQDECKKFGEVDQVIIYNEKQSDNDDEDFGDIIVKIFVQFSMPSGECPWSNVNWKNILIKMMELQKRKKPAPP